ncbi:MAG: hypothetical protein ACYTKD_32355, partial [Planctomycetota bacterium]
QGFTRSEAVETINKLLDFVDRGMERLIGSGTSMTDTGVSLPTFPGIGKIRPDLDGDWAQKLEHSKEPPLPQHGSRSET